MHVGQVTIFQNPDQARSDRDVWRDDLKLALLAEPLGFESCWGVEHHFTDYTMCPDVLQHLTYFAGRTKTIQLGSMVVVLPWHDPIRVAEQVTVLDHMSNGRFILGIGRGLGRVEFEGKAENEHFPIAEMSCDYKHAAFFRFVYLVESFCFSIKLKSYQLGQLFTRDLMKMTQFAQDAPEIFKCADQYQPPLVFGFIGKSDLKISHTGSPQAFYKQRH